VLPFSQLYNGKLLPSIVEFKGKFVNHILIKRKRPIGLQRKRAAADLVFAPTFAGWAFCS
jgi:hypothetical protein